MIEWLKGKKTYIVAAIGVLLAITVNVLGIKIPGVAADPDWVSHQILPWLAAGSLRGAITKVGG